MNPFFTVILLFGDNGVGKSCLFNQFFNHTFAGSKTELHESVENVDGNLTMLMFEKGDRILPLYIAEGVMVVFDLTNRESFENLETWITKVNEEGKAGVVKVLVGNKCDLVDQRAVGHDQAEQLAARHGMKYFETTATNHDSTRVPFAHIARTVTKKREAAMTMLERAASCGDAAAIEQAIHTHGITVVETEGAGGYTLFHHAAKNGHISMIEALVRLGSQTLDNMNESGHTAMFVAAFFDQTLVVEALVRLGSNAIDVSTTVTNLPFIQQHGTAMFR